MNVLSESAVASAEPSAALVSAQADVPVFEKTTLTDIIPQEAAGFHSKFKSWIRAVALVVIFVFLPEQICSAFNYNPAVLWCPKPQAVSAPTLNYNPSAILDREKSDDNAGPKKVETISDSIKYLLAQVAGKENPKVRIILPGDSASAVAGDKSFVVTTKAKFTKGDIESFGKWLNHSDIHPLNCGVYALRDLLEKHNITLGLEQVSVLTLSTDILGKIIKSDEPRLKTSLYAIDTIASSYGLNVQSIRINHRDIGNIETPFIANLEPEHFVLVTKVSVDTITFNEFDTSKTFSKDEFLKKFTGYVLAPVTEGMRGVEVVSKEKKAFIWGSQWTHPYEDTIMAQHTSVKDIVISTLIDIVLAIASFGAGKLLGSAKTIYEAYQMYALAKSIAAIVNTVGQLGVLKYGWNARTTAIVCSAISTAITIAVSYGMDESEAVKSAKDDVLKEAAKDGVSDAALKDVAAANTGEQLRSAVGALEKAGLTLSKDASLAVNGLANSGTVIGNIAINFGVGLVVGAARGYVGFEINNWLSSRIKSDALREAVAGIATSLICSGITLGVTTAVDGLANICGDSNNVSAAHPQGDIHVAQDWGIKSGTSIGKQAVSMLKTEAKNAAITSAGALAGYAVERLAPNTKNAQMSQAIQQLGSSLAEVAWEEVDASSDMVIEDKNGNIIEKDDFRYQTDENGNIKLDENENPIPVEGKTKSEWKADWKDAKKHGTRVRLDLDANLKTVVDKNDYKYECEKTEDGKDKKDENGHFVFKVDADGKYTLRTGKDKENGEKQYNDDVAKARKEGKMGKSYRKEKRAIFQEQVVTGSNGMIRKSLDTKLKEFVEKQKPDEIFKDDSGLTKEKPSIQLPTLLDLGENVQAGITTQQPLPPEGGPVAENKKISKEVFKENPVSTKKPITEEEKLFIEAKAGIPGVSTKKKEAGVEEFLGDTPRVEEFVKAKTKTGIPEREKWQSSKKKEEGVEEFLGETSPIGELVQAKTKTGIPEREKWQSSAGKKEQFVGEREKSLAGTDSSMEMMQPRKSPPIELAATEPVVMEPRAFSFSTPHKPETAQQKLIKFVAVKDNLGDVRKFQSFGQTLKGTVGRGVGEVILAYGSDQFQQWR
ncbi:MAG: cysteine peptidase family C39 domain-containing protein, partial [Candidatus Omnitrophica bacterium]|nr:cysteine peptidase family C39 domain-containing protein [Candidatus Omnitrophota bacterium]